MDFKREDYLSFIFGKLFIEGVLKGYGVSLELSRSDINFLHSLIYFLDFESDLHLTKCTFLPITRWLLGCRFPLLDSTLL